MAKLADRIRNLAKAAKSRREPVVGDIEIDDEPYIGDIELEDDELDDILVMSDEDLDNDFSAEAEESRKYGNKKMGEKRDVVRRMLETDEDDKNKGSDTAELRNKYKQSGRSRDADDNKKDSKSANDERERAGRADNVRKALAKMLADKRGAKNAGRR